ncbi:hypothetical protein BDZ91DRAFT_709816, partial [Kalaharituber pfeilii]
MCPVKLISCHRIGSVILVKFGPFCHLPRCQNGPAVPLSSLSCILQHGKGTSQALHFCRTSAALRTGILCTFTEVSAHASEHERH